MATRVDPDAISTARLLLVEYYTSGRRRHTFESIARRARISRSTVARLAREVRHALPTTVALLQRIEALERRVAALEAETRIPIERSVRWAS